MASGFMWVVLSSSEKLASLETQLITNDVDLKGKLAKLESQVVSTADAVKPEAVGEAQRLMSKLPELQGRVDDALKNFEDHLVTSKAEQLKSKVEM